MSEKVYKIVRVVGTKRYSAVLKDLGSKRDVWRDSKYGVFTREYAEGKITKPPRKYPQAYLMAFDTYKNAMQFLDMYIGSSEKASEYFEIWEAETTLTNEHYSGMEIVGCLEGTDQLVEYWTTPSPDGGKKADWGANEVPYGTVFCRDIMLVKQLEVEVVYDQNQYQGT